MKKKILAILLCVALVASLAVGLAACNKKNEAPAKASNAQTLGTAIAMAANGAAGGGASAAEETGANAEAGINVTVSASGLGSIVDTAINTAVNTSIPALEAALQGAVNSVENFVNENGVKVEELAKDNAEFVAESDYTLKVSVTYKDAEEVEHTDVYYLAVDTNGADIEGTKSFDFSIKVLVPVENADDKELLSVSGSATYSNDIEGLKFGFSANIAGLADAGISAYATKAGTIGIDVNAGANAFGLAGANAKITVELGKLADDKYGADITVSAEVMLATIGTVKANVNVSVIAQKVEETHNFAINGIVEVKLVPAVGDNDYVIKANVTGDATYAAAEDEFVVSVSGNATFNTEAKEAK